MTRKKISSILIMIWIFTMHSIAGDPKVTVPLRFDHYYSYEMAVEAMKALQKTYSSLIQLDLVGRSEEGRAIYCLTVNNPDTGTPLSKPAVYVDGNIHGNEIQATEVALYLVQYLMTHYKKNDTITRIVDEKCFYVVPMVNVDGRYHFFSEANDPSANRGLRRPHDDDHDGLVDEDYPEDLDGDGNICQMRKKDPLGTHKTDPEDSRLMLRTEPGEKGEWILLGEEGIDNDGDGRINEDAEGYVDPNRNWGYDWAPPYVQAGAGSYPFSGTGLKALAEYIRQRPNICVAWAFHNTGGMFLRGPSTKAQKKYHPKDVDVYDFLGYQAERITPGYRYMIGWSGLYPTYGDFGEWMAMIMGAYTFVGELWMVEKEAFMSLKENEKAENKPEEEQEGPFRRDPEFMRQRLQFNDHLAHGRLFQPWKPFKHPVYGDIEIGGWVKMSTRLPDPFMLIDMVHRNAAAVIFSAVNTPEVELDVFEVKKISDNVTRIRTRLINSRAIPTMSYHAQRENLYPMDTLSLSGSTVSVVAGGKLVDAYRDTVKYKKYRPHIQFLFVPGFGKVEHQFLVKGSGKIKIVYHSPHATDQTRTLTVK